MKADLDLKAQFIKSAEEASKSQRKIESLEVENESLKIKNEQLQVNQNARQIEDSSASKRPLKQIIVIRVTPKQQP